MRKYMKTVITYNLIFRGEILTLVLQYTEDVYPETVQGAMHT